ncbi:MAG TPA: MYXO-CTERM sorting domain-containing protein [Minicystis sp.]|nr:MYXO-CTERM sorting domain-containing protein [Minicystis sp.]
MRHALGPSLAVLLLPLALSAAPRRAIAAPTSAPTARVLDPEPSPWLATEEDEEHDDRRFAWWHRQRAYPGVEIPDGAYARARAAWSVLPRVGAGAPVTRPGIPGPPGPPDPHSFAWTSIGPSGVTTTQSFLETPNMGPEAGRASAIAFDPMHPGTIYTGYSIGGVWKSTDSGMTWAPLDDALPSLAIGSIALAPDDPNTLFVGSGEGALTAGFTGAGVFVSMDGGKTWEQRAADTFSGLAIPRLLVDPSTGDLYASAVFGVAGRGQGCTNLDLDVPGQGIYRSTDLGVTWTKLHAGKISDLEIDFTASPLRLLAVDFDAGAIASTDGGATWAPVSGLPAMSGIELSLSQADPTLAFAGTPEGGGTVYVSHDGGLTFAQVAGSPAYCDGQCYYDNSVLADPSDPNTLWLGGSLCGLWKTSDALDAAPTWVNVSAKNHDCGMQSENWYLGYVHPDVHALATEPGQPSHLYAATDGGLARTVDGGTTWERLNEAVSTIQFYALCLDPTDPDVVYGGAQDNGSSFRTGTNDVWNGIISGDGGYCAVNPADPMNVLVTDSFGTVVMTDTQFKGIPGYTFATQPGYCKAGTPGCGDRSSFITPLVADPGAKDTFYIGTYRLYRSTDKGKTWASVSDDLTAGPGSVKCVTDSFPADDDTLTAIAVAPSSSDVIYTGSAAGAVSASFDHGKSWSKISRAPLPSRWVTDVAVDPNDPKTLYVAFSGFDASTPDAPGHVFKSTDGGASWKASDIGADTPVNSLAAHPVGSGVLYAGTDMGALVSADGGASWKVLGKGLPDVPVFALRFHPKAPRLVAGTHGRSAWAIDFGEGALAASPTALSFEATQGGAAPQKNVAVRDTDPYGSIARFDVASSAPWLAATPGKGAAAGPNATSITASVVVDEATVGDQDAKLTLTPAGGGPAIEIPVHLTLHAADVGPTPKDQGGCGCRAAGAGSAWAGGSLAMLAALAAAGRRRRTRARRRVL